MEHQKEIWKDIEGFEGLYKISSLGKVKSFHGGKEKILAGIKDGYGYLCVVLCNVTKSRKKIHRLIAQAFILNPEKKPCINHKNGIKNDNRIENLEWCTYSENNKHAYRTGLKTPVKYWLGKYGENNFKNKPIYQYTIKGDCVCEYKSIMDAHRKTKINRGNICSVCKGNRKTAGGYIWKFKKIK